MYDAEQNEPCFVFKDSSATSCLIEQELTLTMSVKSYKTEKEEGSDKTFAVWYPEGKTSCPVVLFAHGYGLSSSDHDYLASKIAEDGYVVVIPDREGDDKHGFLGILTFVMFATAINTVTVDGTTLQAALDYVTAAAKDGSSSPLSGGVADPSSVIAGGFSMGAVEAINFVASSKETANIPVKALLLVSPAILLVSTVSWRISYSELVETAKEIECPTLYITSDKDMAAVSAFSYSERGKDAELVVLKSEHLDLDCPTGKESSWGAFLGFPGKAMGLNDHIALACEEGPTYKAILPFLRNVLKTGKSGDLGIDPSLLAPKEMNYSKFFQFVLG